MSDNKPLISITLDDINAVPKVYYKGEEVTGKIRVSLDWKTKDGRGKCPTYIHIEHVDQDSESSDAQTIQHNHPLNDKQCEPCLFYRLCIAAKLPHCNGESYMKDSEHD